MQRAASAADGSRAERLALLFAFRLKERVERNVARQLDPDLAYLRSEVASYVLDKLAGAVERQAGREAIVNVDAWSQTVIRFSVNDWFRSAQGKARLREDRCAETPDQDGVVAVRQILGRDRADLEDPYAEVDERLSEEPDPEREALRKAREEFSQGNPKHFGVVEDSLFGGLEPAQVCERWEVSAANLHKIRSRFYTAVLRQFDATAGDETP